jgi:DNA repair protein RecN (Recombination protein N)
MLRFIRIRNLAVIEAVDVEFGPGVSVLTGETGAGKSILVEAVGLLLGGRASSDLVRTGEAQASVEAIFEDGDGEVVIRREVTSEGRSRAFVNGALTTAGALRDLSARFAELHGQHEHQALLDPLTHLPVLDAHAGLLAEVERVGQAWAEVRALRDELDRSKMDGRERTARLELVAFQLGEIERADPQAGEDEALAAERQRLVHAERLERLSSESYAALYDRDDAILAGLGTVWKRVGELAAIDPGFQPFLDARDSIKPQLEELASFLRRYADGIDASPGRLQDVEERLALVERLKRKYGPTLEDVMARRAALARERDLLEGATGSAAELAERLRQAEARYLAGARDLAARRRASARTFSAALEDLLGGLAMERARFEVRFEDVTGDPSRWGAGGVDEAEFYLSANPGEEPRPLARIASGGELSRVMLAMKTLTAGEAPGRTLVFDEVDAGIGGRVAEVVGRRLRSLGSRFQVLCITHLPPIAAQGTSHFRIEKRVRGGRTMTSVERLDPAHRIDEIGRMIAGGTVTDAVRGSARDLLAVAEGRKAKAKGESAGHG